MTALDHIDRALTWAQVRSERAGGYQLEGISLGLSQNAYLAFDPGLGKSFTALGIAQLSQAPVVAFCAPAHLEGVWLDEIAKWCPDAPPVLVLHGVKKLRVERAVFSTRGFAGLVPVDLTQPAPARHWLFVGHETLRVWAQILAVSVARGVLVHDGDVDEALELAAWVKHPSLLVVDELHRFASHDSKQTGALLLVASRAQRVIGLSGTPFKGGVPKLWPALKALAPRAWPNYYEFISRYCAAEPVTFREREVLLPGNPANVPFEAQKELERKVGDTMLRYKRDVVAHLLPEHRKQHIPVSVTPAEATMIGELLDSLRKALNEYGARGRDDRSSSFVQGEVVRVRVACAKLKLKAALETAADISGEEYKCIIWVWHREIARSLEQLNGKVLVADGSITKRERAAVVERWSRTDGGILAATYGAMGTGLDVLARHCGYQIVLELPWDVDELTQSLGRLDRLSQTRKTIHSYLLSLRVPFESSLIGRLLASSHYTDQLANDTRSRFMGDLLGIKTDIPLDDILSHIKDSD